MKRWPALAFVTVLLLLNCTPPPHQLPDISPDFWRDAFGPADISSVKGGGEVLVSLEGEKYVGAADVQWKKAGDFRANFYSVFGGQIASVSADSESGTVILEGKEYRVLLDEKMDSIPFSWGEDLTFRQFISILTGRAPVNPADSGEAPDTITISRRTAEAEWQRGQLRVTARVNRRNERLEEIRYSFNQSWTVRMSDIFKGLARSVELREDDRNYFWIKYQNLKPE
ncbi:MAG: hypothetical protein GX556_19515 [Fibrobacter sp.]|nr:hypothetical protein [Fibrobacter sp.]